MVESDSPISDEQLAARAREGDARALEQLLSRNEVRVLRVLRLLGIPAQDREDVAQEVFIRVFRHLGGFRPRLSFGGWLYRVTVNAAHDHRTRAGRRARGESPWRDELDQTETAPGESPQDSAVRRDLRRRLEQSLGELSERERAVFVLRELEGLPSREVARSLGISGITVRRHLGRARRHLERLLDRPASKREKPLNASPARTVVPHEGVEHGYTND